MDNSNTNLYPSRSVTEKELTYLSLETKQLVTLGRRRHWPFQVLGKAPIVKEQVRLGDWLLVPAQDDSTKIPERALVRIQAIFEAGIRPQGFVLVHEAPKLLKAPAIPREQPKIFSLPASIAQSTPDFVSAFETGFTTLASMIFPMLFFVVAAAMADPILVAVTEDNYWIEIDRWYTE